MYKITRNSITTDVTNVLQHCTEYIDEYRDKMIHDTYHNCEDWRDMSRVKFFKKYFGKQTYTTNLEFRFWVWDFEEIGMRVYVSNQKGACFEVLEDLDADATIAAMRWFWNKIGV